MRDMWKRAITAAYAAGDFEGAGLCRAFQAAGKRCEDLQIRASTGAVHNLCSPHHAALPTPDEWGVFCAFLAPDALARALAEAVGEATERDPLPDLSAASRHLTAAIDETVKARAADSDGGVTETATELRQIRRELRKAQARHDEAVRAIDAKLRRMGAA